MYIKRLSKAQKIALYVEMRENKNYMIRKKAHLILLSYKNYSVEKLMNVFEFEKVTIIKWISIWKISGVLSLDK